MALPWESSVCSSLTCERSLRSFLVLCACLLRGLWWCRGEFCRVGSLRVRLRPLLSAVATWMVVANIARVNSTEVNLIGIVFSERLESGLVVLLSLLPDCLWVFVLLLLGY